jgi:transcriptional regulator with XRE-family HTH domain
MMEKSSKNGYAMSDIALAKLIGQFIKDSRLKKNKTQEQVAEVAGVNRSTVALLEKGKGGTITSLIQLLRALEQLHILEVFKVENKLSPLQLAKLEMNTRQRAGRKTSRK